MEVIIREQDGMGYREFTFPFFVTKVSSGYSVYMGGNSPVDSIGIYEEKKHAVHVMNYIIAQRNYYVYEKGVKDRFDSIFLNIPSDNFVKTTPDENLLDGIPANDARGGESE